MTLERFLTIVQWTDTCPKSVGPHRWKAMLLWVQKRTSEGLTLDDFVSGEYSRFRYDDSIWD